jgi:hypothetical protein
MPKRLEMCDVWSTLKFKICSLRHIRSYDVSRATKGITNATMVSKATVLSKFNVAIIRSKVVVATK